jgi:tRNA uridine 5-carbamoylmethylation protein Kti12
MKKIICLYGGPGTGKTTGACALFARVKELGYNAELNREYVKDWVWEGRKIHPGDQTYFFAKSARKERILMRNGVEFIITDSPLILTHFHGMRHDIFEQSHNTSKILLEHHHAICKHYGYKIDHYFLKRNKPYNPSGRFEDEATAKAMDGELKDFLDNFGIKYKNINSVSEIEI